MTAYELTADETHLPLDTASQRYVDGLNAFESTRSTGAHVVYTLDKPGRRYTRILQVHPGGFGGGVHAFVENATGYVYKPAGWKSPASGVRFTTVEKALAKAGEHPLQSFTGGYLYLR